MFFVNDIDGIKFTGPLEELEKWRQVARKQKVKPLSEDTSGGFVSADGGKAIAAYQKIINNDMVEPLVHAHQIMSSPAVTILLKTPLSDAWELLHEEGIKQVIVTTENRKVLGMLAERDILKRVNIIDNSVQTSQELFVSDVLNREIISTHSISDIRRIAKVLAQFHIDAMPVVEDEKLIGIVTRGDILRGFAENPKLNLWG